MSPETARLNAPGGGTGALAIRSIVGWQDWSLPFSFVGTAVNLKFT